MACTAAEAEMGVTAKLGFVDSNPGTPPANPTQQVEFISDSIRESLRLVRTDGIRGTVAIPDARQREAQKFVSGSFAFYPTPTDISNWIARITGGSSGADLAETLPCFDVFALRGGYGFKYRENRVATAEFSGSEGSPINLTIGVIGRKRDDPAASFSWPSLSVPSGAPWMFHECVLDIDGTEYRFRDFRLTIDNGVFPRFMNSISPTDLPRTERNIALSLNNPWGTSKALLALFRGASASVEIVATNGSNVLTLAMPACRPMEISDPTVPGKEEIMLPLNLMARYETDPGDELVITLAT